MRAFSYAWSRHFRSCDKDGGHAISFAISETSMLHAQARLHANFMVLRLIEPKLLPMEFCIAGTGIFDLFAHVTLILTR